jgi:hypothetical protein
MHVCATPPRVRERRASPRVSSKQRVFVYDPEDALDEVYAGYIVDRSRGGICLFLGRSDIDEGSVLIICATSLPAAPGIEVRVKNRRHRGGDVYFGCEFVRREQRPGFPSRRI